MFKLPENAKTPAYLHFIQINVTFERQVFIHKNSQKINILIFRYANDPTCQMNFRQLRINLKNKRKKLDLEILYDLRKYVPISRQK